jgi:hypothetical protein
MPKKRRPDVRGWKTNNKPSRTLSTIRSAKGEATKRPRPVTVATILGCASETNEPVKNNAYMTPSWAAETLCAYEDLPRQVWEPCCGESDITEVLRSHKIEVVESDLYPVNGQPKLDFLTTTAPLAAAIATNPPWDLAERFVEHGRELELRYLALYLKADWLSAQRRLRLCNRVGYPNRIWTVCKRPDFRNQKAPPINCSWFVWDRWDWKHSELRMVMAEGV